MLSRSPRLRFLALVLLAGAAFLTPPASADAAAPMRCFVCFPSNVCSLSDPLQHSLCGAYCGAGRISLGCSTEYPGCIHCSDNLLPPR